MDNSDSISTSPDEDSRDFAAIPDPDPVFTIKGIMPIKFVVNQYILWCLSILGDKDKAAKALEISRKTIYNRTRIK